MYQKEAVANNNNNKGLSLQEGSGRGRGMELDTSLDYPSVHDNVDAMETENDFDKEMNFVDNGKFLLHSNKKEDNNSNYPNVDEALPSGKQQPMEVGGFECDNEWSVDFTNSNDSALRKKVSCNGPCLLFGDRFVFSIARLMGEARGGHEDRSFV